MLRLSFMRKHSAANPDSTEVNYNLGMAYNNLGLAFMELGQVDDAVKNYEKALTLKPDSTEAHDNLGIAYAYNGLGIAFHSLGQVDDCG